MLLRLEFSNLVAVTKRAMWLSICIKTSLQAFDTDSRYTTKLRHVSTVGIVPYKYHFCFICKYFVSETCTTKFSTITLLHTYQKVKSKSSEHDRVKQDYFWMSKGKSQKAKIQVKTQNRPTYMCKKTFTFNL